MATKIRILPENLTNKIAAGEVVERPASVAKELVENALDAGSKEVVVEIEAGGRKLIKVSDTGSGMSREDALLALERHATSKIACDDDLFSLSTLGFRGEALPSIASVSRLTISTRTGDTVEGTEIYIEGGRVKEVRSCGMAAGTVIAVRNLFFNTPARLKFMKSAETEGGHVGELLTRLAISRPDVRFTYINDGKAVFRALDANLPERVATMLGRGIAAALYPVSHLDGELQVTGLVAAPECSRSAASHLYTYINGRFIRDKVVQHAILQAYRNFLERGRYPVVAIFIEIPPGEVDVNVHPTKHEVRFREQGRVHDAIQHAVESVLKGTPWLKRSETKAGGVSHDKERAARPAVLPLPDPPPPGAGVAGISDVSAAKVAEVRELLVNFQPRTQPPLRPQFHSPPRSGEPAASRDEGAKGNKPEGSFAGTGIIAETRAQEQGGIATPSAADPVPVATGVAIVAATPAQAAPVALKAPVPSDKAAPATGVLPAPATPAAAEPPLAAPLSPDSETGQPARPRYFSSLSVIGQFNASYILCQCGTDLVLVDQHAAHERVAFEKLKRQYLCKKVDSQGLLFPETLDFSFRESAVLQEHLEEFAALGFSLEEFGGTTWLLQGVPQLLAGSDYIRTITDIIEELGSLGRSRTFTDIQEDLLARLACHSVVRGRRTLTEQEIVALFAQMDDTDFSSNCPHGRPVMHAITLADVEKMFKRG